MIQLGSFLGSSELMTYLLKINHCQGYSSKYFYLLHYYNYLAIQHAEGVESPAYSA